VLEQLPSIREGLPEPDKSVKRPAPRLIL
jgi:hypothetical protein